MSEFLFCCCYSFFTMLAAAARPASPLRQRPASPRRPRSLRHVESAAAAAVSANPGPSEAPAFGLKDLVDAEFLGRTVSTLIQGVDRKAHILDRLAAR